MLHRLKNILRTFAQRSQTVKGAIVRSQDYWTSHNVTLHHQFKSSEESLEYFHWRNDQYFNYIQLMPVSGFDGKIVLDYGCGPGHDLVGFGVYSKCKQLIGADVSSSSLEETRYRLTLHGIEAQIHLLEEANGRLPFDDNSIDHIHCSGVLHHTPDPMAILREFSRILRKDGTINIMVYNYDSLWLHLYVAYQRSIVQGLYPDEDIKKQFQKSTDGENCPISNCYRPDEWISLCKQAGLNAAFSGVAVSMFELSLVNKRFEAIMNQKLRAESREFLLNLVFNEHGIPVYKGRYAGIDACFKLTLQ